jgi:hypothetical protein
VVIDWGLCRSGRTRIAGRKFGGNPGAGSPRFPARAEGKTEEYELQCAAWREGYKAAKKKGKALPNRPEGEL